MIEHHQFAACGVLPAKHRRNLRLGACSVGADIEKLDSVLGQRGDDAARVAGHVGHLGAGGGALEAAVQFLRKTQPPGNQRRVHHFRLPGERNGVPGNVTGMSGLFHLLPRGAVGLFQVLVNQPGAGGPDKAVAALLPEFRGGLNGLGVIALKIPAHHVRLGIDEPGIEVALEHHQHALDAGIDLHGSLAAVQPLRGCAQNAARG